MYTDSVMFGQLLCWNIRQSFYRETLITQVKESGENAKIQGMFGFSEISCDRKDQLGIEVLNRNQKNALILFTNA